MFRYIDADRALRMMRNSKQDCPLTDEKKDIWDVAHDCAISCVEAVPTADVVEVVRCKDCKYSVQGLTVFYCNHPDNDREHGDSPEYYCCYGERKENG